jgi:N utilization substance protein B
MKTPSYSKIKFTNARLLAVQALYAHAVSDESWDKVTSRFLLGEVGGELILETDKGEEYITIEGADADLFARIMKAAETNADTIENAIRTSLSDSIQYERLELTMLCLLRSGMAEFFANPDLDTPIIINEYVDIARSFFDGPEAKIVNAILDRFSKIIRG